MASKDRDVRFLITADEAFPAMEELCLQAQNTLDIALHVFSPRTKTRSATAHELGLLDWGDIIIHALERDVKISLLLNDFDPIGATDLHASVWERLEMLDDALAGSSLEPRKNLKILVAHPGGQTGVVVRTVLWPVLRHFLKRIRADYLDKGRALPPGLGEPDARARLWPPVRNFTQTLHQKFLVADGIKAIIGGLDIDERRFDDTAHKLEAHETWHDVSVEISGDLVSDLLAHFRDSWNYVSAFGHSHAAAYLERSPSSALTFELPAHSQAASPVQKASVISAIVRTLSRRSRNPFGLGPRRDVATIEQAHLDMIGQATRLIYIESQFFRSSAIADALADRLDAQPELSVIALLPGAPEEVAYQGDTSPVHRYGEWLQMRAVKKLTSNYPDRFLCFALTGELDRTEVHDRDALFGKSMVYIHSKLLIVDDKLALVSSANMNGRSMEWDVEAGVVIDRECEAKELRTSLWKAHLGADGALLDPICDAKAAIQIWIDTAADRQKGGSNGSAVGPVPFPFRKTKKFAKRHILIPENMV